MRILIIATSSRGGAGTAALRSFTALRNSNVDAAFLSIDKQIGIEPRRRMAIAYLLIVAIRKIVTFSQSKFIQNSDELFTGISINFISWAYKNVSEGFDVIHFHSTYNFANNDAIRDFLRLGKAVVFTMHDERLSTGGCHYSGKCNQVLSGCKNCPLVKNYFKFIPEAAFQHSHEFSRNNPQIEIVSPSTWLSNKSGISPIMSEKKISVIHNPIPEVFFRTTSKRSNNSTDELKIGFIAQDLLNPYKGFNSLISALNNMDVEKSRRINLVIATGTRNARIETLINFSLRHPKSDEELSEFYSEIDLLVVPSIQDNSPSVIGESLAVGTPVIGAAVGGIPELLDKFGQNKIVSNDSEAIEDAILRIMQEGTTSVNYQVVWDELSESRYVEQVQKIYNKALSNSE